MLATLPLNSLERPTGGGGSGSRPAPSRPASAPSNASRPSGGTPQGGGFNLNRDMSASQRPAASRPAGGGATVATRPSNPNVNNPNNGNVNRPNNGNVNRPNNGNVNRPNNGNVNRPNVGNGNNNNINRNVNNINVNRNVVVNPVYHGGPAWGWNRGVVWVPAPAYYGGGFWGPFAIGVTTALIWGTVVNSQSHQTVTSYQVQPSSPGATLLSNYQLTQTQCGPPNLVVIYGPNNSAICANPNNLVSAGEYTVDSSNLSIVSL
jgi:hypothetical protein